MNNMENQNNISDNISDNIENQNNISDKKLNNNLENYISQLTSIEKIVLEIAKKQLESSFDIEKTIGFIEWMENN